jgi:hypothetical protein
MGVGADDTKGEESKQKMVLHLRVRQQEKHK